MSEIHRSTSATHDDGTRELGAVELTTSPDANWPSGPLDVPAGGAGAQDQGTTDVAKDEARATADQAKEGARSVANVGKDEAGRVAQETTQQAKELWQQTRSQLLDQSAEQQTRVAQGLRSLGEELSGMARGSEQQGVASDLAHQASQRMNDVAGWLDERDPGSLVSELKGFARQRPGTFLAAAAVIGLVGGRLSRGLVAEHQDSTDSGSPASSGPAAGGVGYTDVPAVDHSTTGYSAYGSSTGTAPAAGDHPVSESPAAGTGEYLR